MKLITTEVETSYISPGNKDKIAYARREHGKEITVPRLKEKRKFGKTFRFRYCLAFISNNRRFPRRPTIREYKEKYASIYDAIWSGQHACQPFFIYDEIDRKIVLTSY